VRWLNLGDFERGARYRQMVQRDRAGLAEGAKMSFDVIANRGKESAENLKIR